VVVSAPGSSPIFITISASIKVVYANGDGEYEDLIELGLARTTTFSHEHSREFKRLREEAEARGVGLWDACHQAAQSIH
jgi:hypothetical protein